MGKTMPKSTVIYGQKHAVRAANFTGSDLNDLKALIRDLVGPEVKFPAAAVNKAISDAKNHKKMKDAYVKVGVIDGNLILRCKEKKFFGDIEIDVLLVPNYKPKASRYAVVKAQEEMEALERVAVEKEKERVRLEEERVQQEQAQRVQNEKLAKEKRLHEVMNTPNDQGETMRERLLRAAEKGKKLGIGKGTQETLASKGLHAMDERYHGEVLDHQKNRYGRHLAPLKKVWDKVDAKMDFSRWLDEVEKKNTSVPGVAEALTLRNSDTGGLIVEQGGTAGGTMVYLDEEGRKPYEAKASRGTITGAHVTTGEHIFVVGPDNKLYAGKKARAQAGVRGAFNHSSFFSGAPIKTAGSLKVSGGVITELSDLSGHYTPTPAMVVAAIRKLGGGDTAWLDKVQIVVGGKPAGNGTAYLTGEAQVRQTATWSKYSHGPKTSAWAEGVLKDGDDGAWLVRANRTGQLTVSVRKGDDITHHLVADLGKLGLNRKLLIEPGKLPQPRVQMPPKQQVPQNPPPQQQTPPRTQRQPPPVDDNTFKQSPAYHGALNRVNAEALLNGKAENTWLLREGTGGLPVLSYVGKEGPVHVQINSDKFRQDVAGFIRRHSALAINP